MHKYLRFTRFFKKLGLALLCLYVAQCALGAFIHFVKARDRTRRPIQNYFHAVVGLLTIALAMYQVYLGYKIEWPKTTGLEPFPQGVTILYYAWIVVRGGFMSAILIEYLTLLYSFFLSCISPDCLYCPGNIDKRARVEQQ